MCLFELEPWLQYCLRNPQIACKAEHVLVYRWENLKKKKKWRQHLKSFCHLQSLYSSRLIQPYHYQPNLIRCDGTFKGWLVYVDSLLDSHHCHAQLHPTPTPPPPPNFPSAPNVYTHSQIMKKEDSEEPYSTTILRRLPLSRGPIHNPWLRG